MPRRVALVSAMLIAAALAAGCAPRQPEPAPAGTGNGPVIAQLRAAGSDLERPHVLEFHSYFPTRADADRAAKVLAGRGYRTEVDGPDDDGEWQLLAMRESLVTEAKVDALEVEVAQAAKQASGYYDGWGAAVVE